MSVDSAIVLIDSALTLCNYWISRSVLYPPLVFCGIWLLDLSLYWLDLTPIDHPALQHSRAHRFRRHPILSGREPCDPRSEEYGGGATHSYSISAAKQNRQARCHCFPVLWSSAAAGEFAGSGLPGSRQHCVPKSAHRGRGGCQRSAGRGRLERISFYGHCTQLRCS